jgi:squalene synthase HpnC
MPRARFAEDLARFGPESRSDRALSVDEARTYCRQLAQTHYENFLVTSWLLPVELRQHFYHVYSFCRWADDLADEPSSPEERRRLLDWWEQGLTDCYQGKASHPVYLSLIQTVNLFGIPEQVFANLLVAFRQDQSVVRYQTADQLLDYCRHSANPVGHLVLYLGRCYSTERAELADQVCTGLQLANFCQDVAEDYDRGRIYLPQADCGRYGYTEAMFARRECNEAFRQIMWEQVGRAEQALNEGWRLIPLLPRQLTMQVELFIRGGLSILTEIRRRQYDVWSERPQVSRATQARLLLGCAARQLLRRPGKAAG